MSARNPDVVAIFWLGEPFSSQNVNARRGSSTLQNGGSSNPRGYDVSPDGKQFIVMLPASAVQSNQPAAVQINVPQNCVA
jgi:hypothetical protein